MKKFVLYLTLFVASFTSVKAQQGLVNRDDRIQALYAAYITKEIQLTPDEAEKFWPVYEQYNNEIKSLSSTVSELDRQQANLNVKKKYQDRFIKILGADRTNNFFKTDAAFKTKMIDQLRKMRQNNMQKRSGGMMFRNYPH